MQSESPANLKQSLERPETPYMSTETSLLSLVFNCLGLASQCGAIAAGCLINLTKGLPDKSISSYLTEPLGSQCCTCHLICRVDCFFLGLTTQKVQSVEITGGLLGVL